MAGLKRTHLQFRAALRDHDFDNRFNTIPEWKAASRAAFAAWWFIENVTNDDPARTDLFFEIRGIAR